ncbi:hypothetical protein T4E_7855 [Trichinella pseudospiralis]|uniref:Uncharacterized protein n=1 Tax=Trichinella pseudospiralis TaxID=6337 RepID=A0A0V0YBW1_TRIPS|nr:hypothetical protein T4E_7855 [Trichinella pseudospiralis]
MDGIGNVDDEFDVSEAELGHVRKIALFCVSAFLRKLL